MIRQYREQGLMSYYRGHSLKLAELLGGRFLAIGLRDVL